LSASGILKQTEALADAAQGAVLQTASYSVAQLIVGRIVSGIGNGMNTGTVPTWVSETSKAKHRGQLVATQLSIAAFGIVIAYWMNYGFFHLTGQVVWRFPIGKPAVTRCILPI
jgi:MFS family permease